jgi:hypothetical protein
VPAIDAIPAPDAVSAAPLGPAVNATAAPLATAPVTRGSTVSANSADDIARETATALNAAAAPAAVAAAKPAPVVASNAAISDENDFAAVSQRETIQSDAERLARNKAQYQEIAPTALPSRSGSTGPNIVAYALNTSNQPGNRIYSRAGINLVARAERNCRSYASPDQAQIAFLAAGGPEKDRKGLDPDGDGFACGWDPTPFRKVRG